MSNLNTQFDSKRASAPGHDSAKVFPLVTAALMLLTAVITNGDRIELIWNKIWGVGDVWTHYTTRDVSDLEEKLRQLGPSPSNLAALRSGPDIHIWYRGSNTHTRYSFKELDYKEEPTTRINYFYNDGTTIPMGFWSRDGRTTAAYLVQGDHPK